MHFKTSGLSLPGTLMTHLALYRFLPGQTLFLNEYLAPHNISCKQVLGSVIKSRYLKKVQLVIFQR